MRDRQPRAARHHRGIVDGAELAERAAVEHERHLAGAAQRRGQAAGRSIALGRRRPCGHHHELARAVG
ncbi:MAG TPA: hypothetical protein VNM90_27220 [Haliangium sp.]|nr:hypothetical protein [Haliangium sp.]